MNTITIDVSSVTAAMRGKSILERNHIKAMIGRRLQAGDRNGCGYSLIVYDQGEKALRLLQSLGVRIHGVHQGGERG